MRATCPRPSHPPWFDHPNNFWWRVSLGIVEHLTMQFAPVYCHLGPNILLSILFPNTPNCVLPSGRETKCHTHKKQQAKLQLLL
jgi:hypothetical protein